MPFLSQSQMQLIKALAGIKPWSSDEDTTAQEKHIEKMILEALKPLTKRRKGNLIKKTSSFFDMQARRHHLRAAKGDCRLEVMDHYGFKD